MAAVAAHQPRMSAMGDEHVMDTRTPSPVQRGGSNENGEAQYKPDLSAEVALLSTKLVNAINFQTNLDDSLQQTRHELQQSRQQLARVQAEKKHLDDLFSTGTFVRKSETDKALARLRAELILERAAKETAEKAKKQTEGELENLTSALFEEANTMVAAARKDAEAVERKNAQLKSQLEDTELLLASQQEQLQDLKVTMERLQNEGQSPRDHSSIPSTPVTTALSMLEASQPSPSASSVTEASPEHPLYFSSLIMPVLRNDTSAFGEFQDLLLLARRLGAHSRTNSNNSTHNNPSAVSTSFFTTTTSSSSNLPGSYSLSANSSPSSSVYTSSNVPALKESKFYKRVLTEDIEPTLRLDLAPGLSFLSRRTVIGALLQGSLAIEPFPQNKHYYACALCGESRRSELHVRKHRFKTSEDDTVPKPICDYCVARVRTTADFVGFLRVVRDGHWRTDSEEDHRAAWEESIRLRERMFWARVGGGVVPCFQQLLSKTSPPSPTIIAAVKSDRQSLESIPESKALRVEAPSSLNQVEKADADEAADNDDDDEDEDAERVSTTVGIARAIINMASGAAVTAVPKIEPAHDTPICPSGEASEFLAHPQRNEAVSTDGIETLGTEEQAAAAAAAGVNVTAAPPSTPPANTLRVDEDEELAPTEIHAHQSNDSAKAKDLATETLEQTKSASTEPPPSTQESATQNRKSSGVLARVRAMEAKAQSGLPGSFD